MECIHLEDNVKLDSALLNGCFLSSNALSCAACRTNRSLWVCLSCGSINCGRYINAHAKKHYEEYSPLHSICLDVESLAVYCYVCDGFVVNDTSIRALDKLRKRIQKSLNSSKENRKRERSNSEGCVEINGKKQKNAQHDHKTNGVINSSRSLGLRNLGNTCFMNAVLQSLGNIHSFYGYITKLPSFDTKVKKIGRRNPDIQESLVIEELRKTLISLRTGGKTAISPDTLFSVVWKVIPRFRGYQQQDAHEFMRVLLDRLHSELLLLLPYPAGEDAPYVLNRGRRSTIVSAIFGGILQNEVHCLACGFQSKKHDPFLDLSLDIPTNKCVKSPDSSSSSSGDNTVDDGSCSVADCLGNFTELEELEESELYMCSNCKGKQRSTKRFWIRRLPNVLCLHVKRFRWQSCCRVKVDTYVEFPLRGFNMSHYVLNMPETRNSSKGDSEYDLAAVIVHHGTGAGSGHYTAYAIHEGIWYHFNDSTVTVSEEDTVRKCKAYILFYVRRNISLPNYLNTPKTT